MNRADQAQGFVSNIRLKRPRDSNAQTHTGSLNPREDAVSFQAAITFSLLIPFAIAL